MVALVICNAYIFCCAVTGSVGSSRIDMASDSDQTSDEHLDFGGTIDFIDENGFLNTDNNIGQGGENTGTAVFEDLGFAKPTFANKMINSSYMPTSSVKELVEKSEESDTSSGVLDIIPPPEPDPEPAQTSSSSSESTPPEPEPEPEPEPDESSSSEPSTEEPAESDPAPAPDEPPEWSVPSDDPSDEPAPPTGDSLFGDPNTEIFRVNNGGTEVSGSAVDIVTKIVENEIGSTFAPEAIKAQAVTAYTYVKYSNLHGTAPYCLLKESTNSSVRTLVESVIGQGIYYNGELIQAVYSASSAGSTASSQNVWGGYIPYLQGVKCELDELYDPNYGKKKTFSQNEMWQRIYDNAGINLTGDPASWFTIENRTEGKYVGDMTIGGQTYFMDKEGDMLKITGRRFREIIMEYDIRSSAFDIEYNANSQEFIVTTYGYGHGVGLSQNGANNIAKYWGWDYKDILKFYFQGTEVY